MRKTLTLKKDVSLELAVSATHQTGNPLKTIEQPSSDELVKISHDDAGNVASRPPKVGPQAKYKGYIPEGKVFDAAFVNAEMQRIWPQLFSDGEVKLLKINEHYELCKRKGAKEPSENLSNWQIYEYLRRLCESREYLEKTTVGTRRFNHCGKPSGRVSAAQQEYAQQRLAQMGVNVAQASL